MRDYQSYRLIVKTVLSLSILFSASVAAQTVTGMLPDNPYSAATAAGAEADAITLTQNAPVNHPAFSTALQIRTSRQIANPNTPFEMQVFFPISAGINQGETGLVTLEIRCTQTGSAAGYGKFAVVFEQIAAPFEKSLFREFDLRCDQKWRKIGLPFIALQTLAAGQAKLNFFVGYQAQTLQIGNLQLVKMGNRSALPNAGDALRGMTFFDHRQGGGAPNVPNGNAEVINVGGMPFNRAYRINTTTSYPRTPYWIGIISCTAQPIQAGDILYAIFYLRKADNSPRPARANVVVEEPYPPYQQRLVMTATAGTEWKRYAVPVVATENYAANGCQSQNGLSFAFRTGFAPQTVEIGGFELLNLGAIDPRRLNAEVSYEGREPLASWRAQANERIEQNRKSNLTIRVKRATGPFVKGAQIEVRQKKHAFNFGTAVNERCLISDDCPAQQLTEDEAVHNPAIYRSKLLENFNSAVLENEFKWVPWETNPNIALNTVEWLRNNGITKIRGHNLIWGNCSPGFMPPDVCNLSNENMRIRILEHIRQEAGHPGLVGKLYDWDVVNEPFLNHQVVDRLGEPAMIEWFQAARQRDFVPTLYLNETGVVEASGGNYELQSEMHRLLMFLRLNNAPVGGFGIQSHFGYDVTDLTTVKSILDSYTLTHPDLELAVTEYDHLITDEWLQEDYLRDYLTLAFSLPAMKSFMVWGFWDGNHWLRNSPLYRTDWTLKPSGEVWREQVFDKWWARETGRSDGQGKFRMRGFKGEYEIVATYQGTSRTVNVNLDMTKQITVEIP